VDVAFLSVEDVIFIHERVLSRDGGLAGVRDMGLLHAAVMTPRQSFGGTFLHDDLASMAAAYLFHLAKNHAFLDGNKRVALASAIAFLLANDVTNLPDQDEAAKITLAVASGEMSKSDLIAWFQRVLM
jgi:death-on-curing protein